MKGKGTRAALESREKRAVRSAQIHAQNAQNMERIISIDTRIGNEYNLIIEEAIFTMFLRF